MRRSSLLATMVRLRKLSDEGKVIVLSPDGDKTRMVAVSSHYGAYEFEAETFDQTPDAVRQQAERQVPSAIFAEVPPLMIVARPAKGKPVMVDVGAGLFAAWKDDPEGALMNISCDMAHDPEMNDICIEAYLAAEAVLKATTGVTTEIPYATITSMEFESWIGSLLDSGHPDVRELGTALKSECIFTDGPDIQDGQVEFRPSLH